MADKTTPKKDMSNWKPGSEPELAKDVASRGDFGAPVGSGPSRDRDYVNENTKRADPGATQPRSSEHDGVRTAGAGADDSGTGSGSGGDVDTDIIGFGAGGSTISASGPDGYKPGPDDSDGTAREFASGPPTQNFKGKNAGKVLGSTVTPTDGVQAAPSNQGADAATNPAARGDDSFAGEISMGEATGQDNAMSPSSDSQGEDQEGNQMSGNQKDFAADDMAD
jgi:hypothetical protein